MSNSTTDTGRNFQARNQDVDSFFRGEITPRHGILSARLVDLADALDTTPASVLRAARRADVEPMVDTGENATSREDVDRPTAPELRCLAFTVTDFRALAAVVGAEEALNGVGV